MAENSLDVAAHPMGLSARQEAAISWGTSALLHCGVALLVMFAAYAVHRAKPLDSEEKVVIPMFDGIDLKDDAENPHKLGHVPSSTEDAMQSRFPDIRDPGADPLGTALGDPNKLTGMQLEANIGDVDIVSMGLVRVGGPGSVSSHDPGTGLGRAARFGPDREGGGLIFGTPDPKVGNRAAHTVFVLDHSGSMVDTFDYLRTEVRRVVNRMSPAQQFAVVMFSEGVEVLGPDALLRAQSDAKRDVLDRLDRIRAGGMNDDKLEPFQKAFEKAMALKPEHVVFLTDGKFSERLPAVVASLNKDRRVRISTIAFVKIDKRSEEQLREIATDNGGKYRFVADSDLGR